MISRGGLSSSPWYVLVRQEEVVVVVTWWKSWSRGRKEIVVVVSKKRTLEKKTRGDQRLEGNGAFSFDREERNNSRNWTIGKRAKRRRKFTWRVVQPHRARSNNSHVAGAHCRDGTAVLNNSSAFLAL